MELRRMNLQQQLVDLGYNFVINTESVLLVDKLVADLLETTSNLQKYMTIAQNSIEELDNLKFGSEPYKCDNAKLTQQVNDLHLKIITLTESKSKEQREWKRKSAQLEKEKDEFIESNKKQRKRIRELELEATRKSSRGKSQITSNIDSAIALNDQKFVNLTKEHTKLRNEQIEMCSHNEDLKHKLSLREKEIVRLNRMLTGGRPLEALSQDCCYVDMQPELLSKNEEVKYLQKAYDDIEAKLKEAICKQHEAMKHALDLAERNAQLEKELKEIDQMALAVERDCNEKLKNNADKVKTMQERWNKSLVETQKLEKELRVDREKFLADLDAAKIEKRHLESTLDTALKERNHYAQKSSNYSIIENDLNTEIDRLVQQNASQTRIIADLQGQLVAEKAAVVTIDSGNEMPRKAPKAPLQHVKFASSKENKEPGKKKTISLGRKHNIGKQCDEKCCNQCESVGLCSDRDEYINRIKSERDFYIREYKALMEQKREAKKVADPKNCSIAITNETNVMQKETGTCCDTLSNKIVGLERSLLQLQKERDNLASDKLSLENRLKVIQDDSSDYSAIKAFAKRLERERDILKVDVDRLQEEKHSLKQQLRVTCEKHISELDNYKKMISEREDQLGRIESAHYNMQQSHGSNNAILRSLEHQCCCLKDHLKTTSEELCRVKSDYSNLKALHEQTDRAFSNSQHDLKQLEKQLSNYEQHHHDLDNKTSTLNCAIVDLRKENDALKKNNIDVEREKDKYLQQVDEKTEKIAYLQSELDALTRELEAARQRSVEYLDKLNKARDERILKDHELKCRASDIAKLKCDVESAIAAGEIVVKENKRIQGELSLSVTNNRRLMAELDEAKQQIANLTSKVQQYCAQVKRFQDLITEKEVKNSEMLNQFKTLSNEANALESNNHTLENQATETKVQLHVALDHVDELEATVKEQNEMLLGFEKVIAELTSNVSNLEAKSVFERHQNEQIRLELKTLRKECEQSKENEVELIVKLKEKEFSAMQMESELQALQHNHDVQTQSFEKHKALAKNSEQLFSVTHERLSEQYQINSNLQREVILLKNQISDMKSEIELGNERLEMYQDKAFVYSQENKHLRREIVDERFTQAKPESSKHYLSL